jgi:multimeric flavodoxin WrbA
MSTLFINASPNKDGNTARLAAELLEGHPYTTLDLVDYKVYPYGQHFDDDQFDEVVDAIRAADDIVIGAPMYWHSMAGSLRNVLDRSYGTIEEGSLAGRRLWFVFQGAAPTQQQLAAGEYTMSRYASLYGMQYMGMVSDAADVAKVGRDFRG